MKRKKGEIITTLTMMDDRTMRRRTKRSTRMRKRNTVRTRTIRNSQQQHEIIEMGATGRLGKRKKPKIPAKDRGTQTQEKREEPSGRVATSGL